MGREKFEDVSNSESLTFEQEIELLADSSQLSQATVLVKTGQLPLLFGKGDILPLSLMVLDYRVDNSNITLGTDTMRNENLPTSESEGVSPPVALKGVDYPRKEEDMDVFVERKEEEQLDPLMESASTSNVHPIEIRHSLLALQDILNARMFERALDHITFVHINGLIATAKFDQEFNSTCPSIWDVTLKDDSSYFAIWAALDFDPLQVPFDSKVIPVMYDKEHTTTITLVTGRGNNTGDIVPSYGEGVETLQVADNVPLVTEPVDSTIKDHHTSVDDKHLVISLDGNMDYTDGHGLTKEQVDKSCTSGFPSGTSKAPNTVASQAKLGSLLGKCTNKSSPLHLRSRGLSGDYFLPF